MRSRFSFSLTAVLMALPMLTSAFSIAPADFYNDVRLDSKELAGINLLTRDNIVRGYGSRQFGPTRTINRAEFLKIAILASGADYYESGLACFPDVRIVDWYSPFVCAARDQGVVKGYEDGQFHPEHVVTYGEALKMLTTLFTYDVTSVSGHWAEQYYQAAAKVRVDLPMPIDLDRPLTRGQAARLTAAFYAQSKGQLDALRLAESGMYASSTSSMSSSTSSSLSSSANSSSSSSRVGNRPLDPIADKQVRTQFALLGEVSSVLGAAKFYLEEEPFDLTAVSVNLVSEVPSVQSLLVYDDDARYLGRATLNSSTSSTNRNYRLEIPAGTYVLEKRQERSVYFRAQVASKDAGGLGNYNVQIAHVTAEGNGGWSNRKYTKQSSPSDTFPIFVTARSTITSVVNSGQANAPLVPGTSQQIGSFTFTGRRTDSSAKVNVSSLSFYVEQTGTVTISNVKIGTPGIPDRSSCLVSGSIVTCTGIPEGLGSVEEPRTIVVYGDIAAADPVHASLRLTLNDSGTSSVAGSVTWTDGTSTFTWLGVDAPVAMGTYYKY